MGQSPSSQNYTTNPSDYILIQGNADIKMDMFFRVSGQHKLQNKLTKVILFLVLGLQLVMLERQIIMLLLGVELLL